MSGLTRTGDITMGWGSHGLKCCPHQIIGIRVTGSGNVRAEGGGGARAYTDIAVHNCPHCSINICLEGSHNVRVNSLGAHRVGDSVTELCGFGQSVTGSGTVIANT